MRAPDAAWRVIVAVDVDTLDEARALLERLRGTLSGCKIGTQLFTAAGPPAVELARKLGFSVFLDLKFHDIPNTVAGAVRSATRLGVTMLNVHASGGLQMMRAAAEAAAEESTRLGVKPPVCLAVTVLTSLDRQRLSQEVGVSRSVEGHVLHLAELAREAGFDGCVASPREIHLLRTTLGRSWVIVTPGIRPVERDDDQVRIATPAAAVQAGADYLVIGRPITAAPDPVAAARAILAELAD